MKVRATVALGDPKLWLREIDQSFYVMALKGLAAVTGYRIPCSPDDAERRLRVFGQDVPLVMVVADMFQDFEELTDVVFHGKGLEEACRKVMSRYRAVSSRLDSSRLATANKQWWQLAEFYIEFAQRQRPSARVFMMGEECGVGPARAPAPAASTLAEVSDTRHLRVRISDRLVALLCVTLPRVASQHPAEVLAVLGSPDIMRRILRFTGWIGHRSHTLAGFDAGASVHRVSLSSNRSGPEESMVYVNCATDVFLADDAHTTATIKYDRGEADFASPSLCKDVRHEDMPSESTVVVCGVEMRARCQRHVRSTDGEYQDLGVNPCGTRLGIRKGGKGAVRLPKILVLITCECRGRLHLPPVPGAPSAQRGVLLGYA